MTRTRGRSFKVAKWERYYERQARLTEKRLGEDNRVVDSTLGLVAYVFSRLRCKPTACRVEAGLFSGAGVARRRALDDTKEIMSDTSTTTIGEQSDEQLRTSRTRQSVPNVMGGGVECQGGTPDAPVSTKGEKKASTSGFTVSVLRCQGCQGSSRTIRGRVRVGAHTPAHNGLVCTPDTPDTDFRCSISAPTTPLPSGRVSAPRPPTSNDAPVRGVRGLNSKPSETVFGRGGGRRC